jgi:hypothetical protein
MRDSAHPGRDRHRLGYTQFIRLTYFIYFTRRGVQKIRVAGRACEELASRAKNRLWHGAAFTMPQAAGKRRYRSFQSMK